MPRNRKRATKSQQKIGCQIATANGMLKHNRKQDAKQKPKTGCHEQQQKTGYQTITEKKIMPNNNRKCDAKTH